MKRGPKPKPPERRYGHRTPNTLKPNPDRFTPPEAPEHLGDHGQARWDAIWSHAYWLYEEYDLEMITRLCEAYDDRAKLREAIEEHGLIVAGYNKQPRINPAMSALRALDDQINKMESSLGFSPSDRARLGITAPPVESELDRLLNASP